MADRPPEIERLKVPFEITPEMAWVELRRRLGKWVGDNVTLEKTIPACRELDVLFKFVWDARATERRRREQIIADLRSLLREQEGNG